MRLFIQLLGAPFHLFRVGYLNAVGVQAGMYLFVLYPLQLILELFAPLLYKIGTCVLYAYAISMLPVLALQHYMPGIIANVLSAAYVIAYYWALFRFVGRLRSRLDRGTLPADEDEDLTGQAQDALDLVDFNAGRFHRDVADVVSNFRARNGIPKHTKANLLVVRQKIHEIATRVCDDDISAEELLEVVTTASALAFVPSAADVRWSRLLNPPTGWWARFWEWYNGEQRLRERMGELREPLN